jgi:uncharacterized protein
MPKRFRVLALDGGGSKGAYSLGALFEVEKLLGGEPLSDHFDMIYGTSTGAIIGAFLGLGYKIEDIFSEYKLVIPRAFSPNNSKARSKALIEEAARIFENKKFDQFKIPVGFVSTNVDQENARIFKSKKEQSFSGKASFIAGFGATIADAVIASGAAVPYLESHSFRIPDHGTVHLIDGGFVANNPSLFALTDAIGSLRIAQRDISLISVGCGKYHEQEPPSPLKARLGKYLVDQYMPTDIFSKALSASSDATSRIVDFAFPEVAKFRLSEVYRTNGFVTHLLETDLSKLEKMYAFGRRTFCEREAEFLAVYRPSKI